MTDTSTLAVVASIASLGLAGWSAYNAHKLRKRITAVFANIDSQQNLEETITEYFQKVGATEKTLTNLRESYQHLSEIGTKSLQKIGVVRFNPFRNTGGDQSFVLALLDNHDSGILLTSIHGREGTRTYIKSVEYGRSAQAMSSEEEAALSAAKKGNTLNTETPDGTQK